MKIIRHTYYDICLSWCLPIMMVCLSACTGSEDDITTISNDEITIIPSIDNTHAMSRASLYDIDEMQGDNMVINTYMTGTNTLYFDTYALYENSDWVFFKGNYKGLKYFWPVAGKLDFFAYFPDVLTKTKVTDITYAAGAPSFKYTGVSPVTEANQSDLQEFIFAYVQDCGPENGGKVDLAFHHPMSQIKFQLDQAIRCTIESIKITDIKNAGTATCNGATSEPYLSWTTSGDNTNIEIDYSAMDAYSAYEGIRYPEDINSESNLAEPFLVVPQSLTDDSYIEVTYKALGSSKSTTVKSLLNKAYFKDTNDAVAEWKPGNSYTYSLTLNGAADEIFVGVSINDWIIEGESETEVK